MSIGKIIECAKRGLFTEPYPSSDVTSLSCLNLQSGLVQEGPYLHARGPDDGTAEGFSSAFGGSSI